MLPGTTLSYGQQVLQEQAIINVLNSFHQAIVENDVAKAGELLADSARILKGGNNETKEEYLSHHFHSDGKFLSAMKQEIQSQEIKSTENAVWISTFSHMTGTTTRKPLVSILQSWPYSSKPIMGGKFQQFIGHHPVYSSATSIK